MVQSSQWPAQPLAAPQNRRSPKGERGIPVRASGTNGLRERTRPRRRENANVNRPGRVPACPDVFPGHPQGVPAILQGLPVQNTGQAAPHQVHGAPLASLMGQAGEAVGRPETRRRIRPRCPPRDSGMSGSLEAGRREMLAADELASPILPHRIWEFLQSTHVDLSNGSCINTEKPCSDEENARWPQSSPSGLDRDPVRTTWLRCSGLRIPAKHAV